MTFEPPPASCPKPLLGAENFGGVFRRALDARTNFWFKRIEFVNAQEETMLEMNLAMTAEIGLA